MNIPNKKVLCFGEILIRLQCVNDTIFEQGKNNIKLYPGGSEANVAVTLAKLGIKISYFTVLPKNALSQEIENLLKSYQIDTSKFIYQGDRIGSYYLLSANGLTNGEVIYDRKYSSFSELALDDVDWDKVFQNINWFHFTAITPALSEKHAKLCEIALQEATRRNITISVDLNFRSKLWQYGKSPLDIMPNLIQYVNVIMGNIWAANKMLGTPIDEKLNRSTSKEEYIDFADNVARTLLENYPKVDHIANTYRFMDTPNHNLFYGTYHNRQVNTYSNTRETLGVIDRIGSGDAFMGGLIYALLKGLSSQEVIDTATSAGFEKLFVEGDFGNGKI